MEASIYPLSLALVRALHLALSLPVRSANAIMAALYFGHPDEQWRMLDARLKLYAQCSALPWEYHPTSNNAAYGCCEKLYNHLEELCTVRHMSPLLFNAIYGLINQGKVPDPHLFTSDQRGRHIGDIRGEWLMERMTRLFYVLFAIPGERSSSLAVDILALALMGIHGTDGLDIAEELLAGYNTLCQAVMPPTAMHHGGAAAAAQAAPTTAMQPGGAAAAAQACTAPRVAHPHGGTFEAWQLGPDDPMDNLSQEIAVAQAPAGVQPPLGGGAAAQACTAPRRPELSPGWQRVEYSHRLGEYYANSENPNDNRRV